MTDSEHDPVGVAEPSRRMHAPGDAEQFARDTRRRREHAHQTSRAKERQHAVLRLDPRRRPEPTLLVDVGVEARARRNVRRRLGHHDGRWRYLLDEQLAIVDIERWMRRAAANGPKLAPFALSSFEVHHCRRIDSDGKRQRTHRQLSVLAQLAQLRTVDAESPRVCGFARTHRFGPLAAAFLRAQDARMKPQQFHAVVAITRITNPYKSARRCRHRRTANSAPSPKTERLREACR